ncbi:hypothetical protein [Pseudacidovorax intermedius]|uniref:Uncharacterized protein n=1 Tax=Pseudacidovorax intermedius TaxID=433924 RepID=A0A147GNI2_9BURK|nr:hypothetical protein [Pseudacidovorax intermedius]KTT15382.1 hypothetical protein NS331_20955 [Pseudacidovorax intermedius]
MKVRSTWRSVRLEESALEQALHRRHSLRLHGWLIGSLVLLLMWAFAAMLRDMAHVDSLALRYLFTLGLGYATYLGLLRLWARRLLREDADEADDWSDLAELLPDRPDEASAGRDGDGVPAPRGGRADQAGPADRAGGEASGLRGLASDALDAASAADEGAVVVVPVVAIFLIGVAVVMGAGSLVWLYFGSEALLAVAVEVAFSYAAVRTTRRLAREGWLGAAVRLTWKPLLGALLCAVLLGALVDRFVPQARTLPEALRIIAARR